jgi:hypothetical protein
MPLVRHQRLGDFNFAAFGLSLLYHPFSMPLYLTNVPHEAMNLVEDGLPLFVLSLMMRQQTAIRYFAS